MGPIEAVTFDFFNTLIFHREGRGRGKLLMEYLAGHGFQPAPWEHAALYDVFDAHDAEYAPEAPRPEREAYHVRVARRVFRRLEVPASEEEAARHAPALWEILGPAAFGVFPEVHETLRGLTADGYPLALISNWQRGLRHFCAEMGLAEHFDHVLGSADLGVAKPDGRIFAEAAARLGVPPARILHVGDTMGDDYEGGKAAGFEVVLVDRGPGRELNGIRVIGGLDEVRGMLRQWPGGVEERT